MKVRVIKKARTTLIGQTQSVCPVCLRRIDAVYNSRDGKVYLEKKCPEHGNFFVMVWGGEGFNAWRGNWKAEPASDTESSSNCPKDCGICASHRQETCCVLLEVTSRCNLRCPVCFAAAGDRPADAKQKDPSIQEITGWYDMLMDKGGPFNIQLSGGEPTMRDDLAEIISLGRDKGFTFFQLNTNGIRIADEPEYLERLVQAGLNTVFLQFDGLSVDTSKSLRGADILNTKLKAVVNCAASGVGVVLVPTVVKGVNDGELGGILEFASGNMPTVRGVHFQPVSLFGRFLGISAAERITIPELLRSIEDQTGGRLLASDFSPSGAEHPLCGFHADYLVMNGKWKLQKSNSDSCCGNVSSKQAREVVARKWSRTREESAQSEKLAVFDLRALDDFLRAKEENTLAISGMAFQDAWSLDLDRLRQCYIHVVSRDGRLIPFCAYNLTADDGTALYRDESF